MSLAPIIVFAYNRPEHLRRTLEALSKNDLAAESVLYIYCDGPRSDASDEQKYYIAENRRVAHETSGFKDLQIVERCENVGLADNIVGAVSEIVNIYGRVITLEDDVVTSSGFLHYMNKALDLYENDERVMHITGFMWHHRIPMPATFFYQVPECGGGWATWKRAWKYFNNDANALYNYWKTDWDRFNVWGGKIFQNQLEANLNGTLKTWFIKWHAVVLQRNGLTLYPGRSLTTNIGFDGSGQNCHRSDNNPFYYERLTTTIDVKRIPIRESLLGRYQIYCAQQGHWYSARNRYHLCRYFQELYNHVFSLRS